LEKSILKQSNAGRVKNGRSKRYLIIAFVFFAAITILFLLTGKSGSKAIEITNTDTGKAYFRANVEDGGEFAVEFIHSVNNSPVRETFKVEGKLIRPASVRFFSFGAGMQTELEEGMSMARDGNAMVITGFSRAYSELNYIVGTVSDHLLMLNGQTISLRELCGKNAHVTIRVKN